MSSTNFFSATSASSGPTTTMLAAIGSVASYGFVVAWLFAGSMPTCSGQEFNFFEAKIRPVLVEHCYSCHNSHGTAEGGLAVDSRAGIRQGSATGIAVVPSHPEKSLLLNVLRHEIEGFEMPQGGAQLPTEVVAHFEQWIRGGALDPRNQPPSATALAEATSWEAKLAKRKQWWCFQPIRSPVLPAESSWSKDPIDRFVFQEISRHGLDPAAPASRRTLIRRLSYALTGLPPTQAQIDQYLNDTDPQAFESLVDRFLDSPHFGERWARHWMDLVRYADTHGSEGDPQIPHAYRYRDYLIRAFNDDVPYDQLLREHIAGDLLKTPRINQELGINESAIGTAHWRLVFHGFAPTDALDEKIRFTDDQINVLGKAFQALTISCARCHDHKFDAISQADYYALFGVLGSCRPTMQDVNTLPRQHQNKHRLQEIKDQLRFAVAEAWVADVDQLSQRLERAIGTGRGTGEGEFSGSALATWREMQQRLQAGQSFCEAWKENVERWTSERSCQAESEGVPNVVAWDLGDDQDYVKWFARGNGLDSRPVKAGEFTIVLQEDPIQNAPIRNASIRNAPIQNDRIQNDRIIEAIFPGCALTHRFSTLHRGILASPRIELDEKYDVWMRLIGGGGASARYVVQNYPRDGTVYPIHTIKQANWYWQKFDLGYWQGDQIHLELATAKDAPVQVKDQDRSWFGVREVLLRKQDAGGPSQDASELQSAARIYATAKERHPHSMHDLVRCYELAIQAAIEAWKLGAATDEDALLLNACLQDGLFRNTTAEIASVKALLASYRTLERQIPKPTRVPGLAEAEAFDQPLFERGNHRQPQEPVPRRFLEAIDRAPFASNHSGRYELAQALTNRQNPLTARVIVNRIWHYLFGQGIVATPDNFGQLGELPTHPELLDYLATQIEANGWSIKQTIRTIVLTKTWQQSATGSAKAEQLDPQNRLLSHAPIRRLDAESIRDSLVFASGGLDETMYGPGFPANSHSRRRSIYVRSVRNSMDSLLSTFDSPVPFSTTGRRSATNVPAQSLTLMNDPLVIELARQLASEIQKETTNLTDTERMASVFQRVLGRPPGEAESRKLLRYYETTQSQLAERSEAQDRWSTEIATIDRHMAELVAQGRAALLGETETARHPAGPEPIACWDFRRSLKDSVGKLDLQLFGAARQTDDGLVLGGKGYAASQPIGTAIGSKTLEAWVQLDQLDQRGGGVITIQTLDGAVFDSLVFAEQAARHWLAGSDAFRRTSALGGSIENEAVDAPIQLAMVYDADGTIRAYRNGVPYGEAYRKADLMTYPKNGALILFGLRHGNSVAPGRMLSASIVAARLYDRALTAAEVRASGRQRPFFSQSQALAALSEALRVRHSEYRRQQTRLAKQLQELGPILTDDQAWTQVVHAIMNLKEFLYLQ